MGVTRMATKYDLTILATALLSFFLAQPLSGDNLYGYHRGNVPRQNEENAPLVLPLDSFVNLDYPDQGQLLKGIEIIFLFPSAMTEFRNNYIFQLFNALQPEPEEGQRSYQAQRLSQEILPPLNQFSYILPLEAGAGFRSTRGTSIHSPVLRESQFPLVLTVTTLSKDLPGPQENIHYEVSYRPILSDQGALRLVLPGISPENRALLVMSLNGNPMELNGVHRLNPGFYDLELHGGPYRTVQQRIAIEPGEVHTVELVLESQSPFLTTELPSEFLILVNGVPWDRDAITELPLEFGVQQIQILLGERQWNQTLEVTRGTRYILDIQPEWQTQD